METSLKFGRKQSQQNWQETLGESRWGQIKSSVVKDTQFFLKNSDIPHMSGTSQPSEEFWASQKCGSDQREFNRFLLIIWLTGWAASPQQTEWKLQEVSTADHILTALDTHLERFNSWNPISELIYEKIKFVVALNNNKRRITNSLGVPTTW